MKERVKGVIKNDFQKQKCHTLHQSDIMSGKEVSLLTLKPKIKTKEKQKWKLKDVPLFSQRITWPGSNTVPSQEAQRTPAHSSSGL